MRRVNLDRTSGCGIDPRKFAGATTGKYERVETVMVHDRQVEVAVRRNVFKGYDQAPHLPIYGTGSKFHLDLAQQTRLNRRRY